MRWKQFLPLPSFPGCLRRRELLILFSSPSAVHLLLVEGLTLDLQLVGLPHVVVVNFFNFSSIFLSLFFMVYYSLLFVV